MKITRPKITGLLTGIAVTCVATGILFITDLGRYAELRAFDVRMRHCNNLSAAAPIVHIDIDDGSLDRIGRWPWKRREIADVVRTLGDLGAKYIVVDLLLSEPEPSYIRDPRFESAGDFDASAAIQGEVSEKDRVFGDLELADAIRTAGNVYLAAQFDVAPPGSRGSLREQLVSLAAQGEVPTTAGAIAALRIPDTSEQRRRVGRELLRMRAQAALLADFTLTDEYLARVLNESVDAVGAIIAGVKRDVARDRVGALFAQAASTPTREEVLEAILGERKNILNPDRADVESAYAYRLGVAEITRRLPDVDTATADHIYTASKPVPPYWQIGAAARGIGSVNFVPDLDGSVRRVPLAMTYDGKLIPHLGLGVVCDYLQLDLGRLEVRGDGYLRIPPIGDSAGRDLPLDEGGRFVIRWTQTGPRWREGVDFPHIPAAKIYALAEKQREIEENNTRIEYHLADIVAIVKGGVSVVPSRDANVEGETFHADNPFRARVNRQVELTRAARQARLRRSLPDADIAAMEAEAAALLTEIRRDQATAISAVQMTCKELEEITTEEYAEDPELRETAEAYRRAQKLIEEDINALRSANKRLEQNIDSMRSELAAEIKDKFVFLGFAATAAGDIVPTPIDSRTNGVMCHADIVNSILQQRYVAVTPTIVNVAICLALGCVIALITSWRGPKFALIIMLGVAIAYALQNGYVWFLRYDTWMGLAAATITITVVWAVVTLFRQLTAERERRFFAKQLGQYTAPAIAAKIAESPEAAKAFKSVQTRDVTCFFSDLRGFTTITEKEDAEVVQHVLNTYLERMSRAIWSGRGLINKFMGDGIMAFFNASVDPIDDHPRVACETALHALAELEALKRDQKDAADAAIFDQLNMRIGLASGLCKNGDMGSELKADYTVIGDIVNLAARLEPANKVFGTQIMVSGPTRDAVLDHYEFRYLAELQVKGKSLTVPVYEIVCPKGGLTPEQREYIDRFEKGVELYKERKWDECIVHFTRILSRRFDDSGASRYIDACQELKTFPPDDDWNCALELKEK